MMLASREPLMELARSDEGPVLSVYVPVTPTALTLESVRIALKDAEHTASAEADALGMPHRAREVLLAPVSLALEGQSRDPWSQAFAVIATPTRSWSGFIRHPATPTVAIGHTAVLTPLVDALTPPRRFHVLAISQHQVRVFAGDRDRLTPIEVPGLPATMADALHDDEHVKRLGMHGGAHIGRGIVGTMHGYDNQKDERKDDLVRFFQRVAAALDTVPSIRETPLVLASVAYEAAIYRSVDRAAHVLDEPVAGNPDLVDMGTMHARAWAVVEPALTAHDRALAETARDRLGTGLAGTEVRDVLVAATEGRVTALFVRPATRRWGTYDAGTGEVVTHDERRAGDDDLVSRAIAATVRARGLVLPIEPGSPLDGEDLVALYRY
jgi:hypothetical protein